MRFDSTPGGSARGTQWMWFITLLGLALRLYDLAGESFWLDEIVAVNRVNESIRSILTAGDSSSQGPIFGIWMKWWGTFAGTDEWTLRLWPAIWGTLCIPSVYFLARQLFSVTIGVLAALFMAVHPFAIHYSQDARPYSLFLLCSLVSSYLLIKLLRQHRWPTALAYILATAAAVYVHPFAAFLVLAHVWMYFWFRRERRFHGALRYPRPYVWTFVVLCLVCLPEALQAAQTLFGGLRPNATDWIEKPTLTWPFVLPADYFMWWKIGGIAMTITVIPAVWRGLSEEQLRLGFRWMIVMGICFWLLPWLIAMTVKPIAVMRYTTPGFTVVILLMAVASTTLQALPRQIYIAALLALTVLPLWGYYTGVDKDPWRQQAEFLSAALTADDRVVAIPSFTSAAAAHYLPFHQQKLVANPTSVEDLRRLGDESARLWIIESYLTVPQAERAMLDSLANWGESRTVWNALSEVPLHAHRFWAAPIMIREWKRTAPERVFPLPDSLSNLNGSE